MARVKVAALFMISLLLISTLSFAARPDPAFHSNSSPANTQEKGIDAEGVDENCEGVGDQEECLMRRTLAAHLDYIYTQKHKP